MTTYPTDFIRIETVFMGTQDVSLPKVGLEWPPPERIYFEEDGRIREATDADDPRFVQHRMTMSVLDDEVAAHPSVARGATYCYATPAEVRGQLRSQTPAEQS